ncbi:hypothetical protein SUNI508_02909 [Seiridium unicorne]|uniref:fructose-bisphosphatase n=1 Tax=Seiridium unicorne TaxID=138068 RepID=A0ABR2VHQ7_9PEZI
MASKSDIPPAETATINTSIVTLTRFLTEEQTKVKEATGDFTLLCHALQFSFKAISYYIRRATLVNLTGLAGQSNATGDDQKKLDVIGNDIFIEAMRSSGKCALVVSEEEEDIIFFKDKTNARYAVACDPIDGSSNLDAGVSVGTIFGIHKLAEGSTGTKEDILKPGTELLAAGFTMYGASAQLVITMKGGSVNGFTLDASFGEFILTHPDMQIPKTRGIYSCNEGNSLYWEDNTKEYFNSLKFPQDNGKPYSSRYIGSMVADAYRTLLYGGIFAYPADKKSPKGKLRILYECAPMAMVFENAGGQAVDSKMNRMLEVVPEHIHDRAGIYMGSFDEVEKVKAFHKVKRQAEESCDLQSWQGREHGRRDRIDGDDWHETQGHPSRLGHPGTEEFRRRELDLVEARVFALLEHALEELGSTLFPRHRQFSFPRNYCHVGRIVVIKELPTTGSPALLIMELLVKMKNA